MRHFQVHRVLLLIAILISVPTSVLGQERPPIKDNSFLIEEAYNQEPGVIQWIATVQHFASPSRYWGIALTNEIPLHGMRHQFSWTFPLESENEWDNRYPGDLSFHYRYQIMDGTNGVAIAPRLSMILPTGEKRYGDSEDVEWQTNFPVSMEFLRDFALHLNAGATLSLNHDLESRSESEFSVSEDFLSLWLGGSIVWRAHPNGNLLLEIVHYANDEFRGEGKVARIGETIVNPGTRIAINAPFGQFVPGFALPIRFADGETDIGIFGYLSFEHSL